MTLGNQIVAGGGGPALVPGVDTPDNVFERDVVGNKSDASDAVVGTTSSLVAMVKGVLDTIGGVGISEAVIALGPFGNPNVQRDVDSAVRYAVYLINLAGDILTDAETVPGTFTVHRVRAGSDTEIIAATAATEANGVISAVVDFTTGTDWDEGDLGYIEFTGITATPSGGATTSFPVIRKGFRVSQEFDIEAKIDTIDGLHDVPVADASPNLTIRDVVGNKSDAAATGAVTAVESQMAYAKQLVTEGIARDAAIAVIDEFHDVPAADETANDQLNEVIGNKTDAEQEVIGTTRSLVGIVKGILAKWLVPSIDSADNVDIGDVVGNKADARVTTVGVTASLMAYLKGITNLSVLATGTLTTDSATVPADTGRAEEDNYWDGSWLIPLSGSVILQPRLIAAFANTGGVFTLDSEHPFTTTPGTVEYVIVGANTELVPAADSSANQTSAHVAGNKADAAATGAVSATETLMAYLKQAVTEGIARDAAIAIIDEFHDVPAQDATANAQLNEVIGNKTDAAQTTVGTTRSLMGYIKGILSRVDVVLSTLATSAALAIVDAFHDVPANDSTDNNQMRDVVGSKADAATTALVATASLMAYLKGITNLSTLAAGTFTTDSATVPADTGRGEADNYWDGSWLIPLTGNVAFQPRLIGAFANTGGVFTLDSEHPFTTTPGTVAYIIVGSSADLVPAADSTANQTSAHVVGQKIDAAVTTVGTVASVIAYLKGLLNQIGAPAGASVSADILEVKNLVDSIEAVGPFSLVDNTAEQTVVEDIALTTRRHVSIEFDLTVLTQDGTIRLYRKVDGTTFRLWSTSAFSAAGVENVFDFQFTTNQHWQLSYQATVTEGAARSIPFNTITEEIE